MKKIIVIFAAFLAGIGLTIGAVVLYPRLPLGQAPPPPPEAVKCIRIELQKYVDAQVEGSRLDVPKRPTLIGTPDYYLEIQLRGDTLLRTARYDNTPVGNGLEWVIDPPLQLADIREVRVFDGGVFSDSLVDRVLISQRREEGQFFNFFLHADIPPAAQPLPLPPSADDPPSDTSEK